MTSFDHTHMQHLEYCHSLTGAAGTALPVVHSGVEPSVGSLQSEVYTLSHRKKISVINIKMNSLISLDC